MRKNHRKTSNRWSLSRINLLLLAVILYCGCNSEKCIPVGKQVDEIVMTDSMSTPDEEESLVADIDPETSETSTQKLASDGNESEENIENNMSSDINDSEENTENNLVLENQESDGDSKEDSSTDAWESEAESEEKVATDAQVIEKDLTGEGSTLSIVAVGDDLIHRQVIQSGLQSDGSYDFTSLFEEVKPVVQNADLAIINQETMLVDENLGYSGYPTFGSPTEIGDAVVDAGFDVVLHATNHAMDKGTSGIQECLDYWKTHPEMKVIGINESDDLANRVALITKNDITVSILNYTYGLNGFTLPADQGYLVNLLTDREEMEEDIKYAKENSEFVIVCPHWGSEYIYEPTSSELAYAEFFLEQGVDLVLGTHPHVLQPVEWLESVDGTKKMLVYYSLGNFISNQDQMPRMLGGMASITLKKEDGKVTVKEAAITPLVTHSQFKKKQTFTTYLLSDYTTKLASEHYLNRTAKNTITLEKLEQLAQSILGDWYAGGIGGFIINY